MNQSNSDYANLSRLLQSGDFQYKELSFSEMQGFADTILTAPKHLATSGSISATQQNQNIESNSTKNSDLMKNDIKDFIQDQKQDPNKKIVNSDLTSPNCSAQSSKLNMVVKIISAFVNGYKFENASFTLTEVYNKMQQLNIITKQTSFEYFQQLYSEYYDANISVVTKIIQLVYFPDNQQTSQNEELQFSCYVLGCQNQQKFEFCASEQYFCLYFISMQNFNQFYQLLQQAQNSNYKRTCCSVFIKYIETQQQIWYDQLKNTEQYQNVKNLADSYASHQTQCSENTINQMSNESQMLQQQYYQFANLLLKNSLQQLKNINTQNLRKIKVLIGKEESKLLNQTEIKLQQQILGLFNSSQQIICKAQHELEETISNYLSNNCFYQQNITLQQKLYFNEKPK